MKSFVAQIVARMWMESKVSVAFVSLLMVFATLASVSLALESIYCRTERFSVEVNGVKLGVMKVVPRGERVEDVAVFMIPGLLEPKEAYKSLAIELSKIGLTSYALDLVGQGDSNKPIEIGGYYSIEEIMDVTMRKYSRFYEEVISKIMESEGIRWAVIVGEGLGGSLAISVGGRTRNVLSVVAISPEKVTKSVLDSVNATIPRNLLVVVGSLDPKDRIENAYEILKKAGVIRVQAGKTYGDLSRGCARKLVIADLSVGFLNYFHGQIHSEVVSWVSEALGIDAKISFPEAYRLYLILASLVVALGLIIISPAFFSKAFGVYSGGKRWARWDDSKRALVLAMKWYGLSFLYVPLALLLVLAVGGRVALPAYAYILIAYDIVAVIVSVAFISKLSGRGVRNVFIAVSSDIFKDERITLLGVALATFQLAVLWVVLQDIALSLTPLRKVEIFLAVLAVLPLQVLMNLAYETFFRRYVQELLGGVTVRAIAVTVGISALTRILIMVAFAAMLTFVLGTPGFAMLILVLLTFVQIAIEGVAAITYKYTREVAPAAITNSSWALLAIILSPVVTL